MPDPGAAETHLRGHLDPGEELLWAGSARPRWFVWPSDLATVLGGIIVILFGVAFFFDAVIVTDQERTEEMGPQVATGIAFAIVWTVLGVSVAALRLIQRRWMARRCSYGLTQSRAVVVYEGRWLHRSREAFLDESELDVRRRRDGSGSLTFRPVHAGGRISSDPLVMLLQNGPLTFWELAEIDPVVAQVRQLRMTRRDRTNQVWGSRA